MTQIQSICVYCGSSPGENSEFEEKAFRLGELIADADIRLIYGGGTKGLMGAVSKGVMSKGGKVTGIIPRFLMDKEATRDALGDLDELIITEDMHERKLKMFDLSDAFVTLPGGIGTLEEVVEVLTWGQLGRHQKPILLANFDKFWDPLLELLKHMIEEGFVHTRHRVRPLVVGEPEEIIGVVRERAASVVDDDGDWSVIEKM